MRKYLRFVYGLWQFAQSGMEPEEAVAQARALLHARIAAREENFLEIAGRGIFRYAQSPYLPLLAVKKITLEDVRRWVLNDGLEAALRMLEQEGVYFTVDEFKGKVPVRRGSVTFRCDESSFDNPYLSSAYEVRSGATRSAGTRVRIDFDYLRQRCLYDALLLHLHGCLAAPIANWFPVFPGAPGINSSLRFARIGSPVQRWFSQVTGDQVRVSWEKRLGTTAIFAVHRLAGRRLAEPEYVGLQDAIKVARWAADALAGHGRCAVYTFAASAVRVCAAAAEAGLSLKGARFFVTGEPLTATKKREIESAGATAVPVYGISEAGVIAAGCDRAHPESDSCHLYKDTAAIVMHRHMIPHFDAWLDSYLFTTLLYESPKLLLNVGMGDYGGLAAEKCDCALGVLGFDTILNGIRSYEKLTGEGVTFVDTDFMQILEKELPERFGGRSTDYQLMEEEDAQGITRLHLLVSPRLGEMNEREVVDSFMRLMRRSEASPESWTQSGVEMWRQSGAVRVVRNEPVSTASGKVLPFHLRRSQDAVVNQAG